MAEQVTFFQPQLGQPRQLAQSRQVTVTAQSLYSPARQAIIKRVVVSRVIAGAGGFRIYLDDDGTTYDESTALIWDYTLTAGSIFDREVYWPMDNPNGNLAIRPETASAFTFTLFGDEVRKGR